MKKFFFLLITIMSLSTFAQKTTPIYGDTVSIIKNLKVGVSVTFKDTSLRRTDSYLYIDSATGKLMSATLNEVVYVNNDSATVHTFDVLNSLNTPPGSPSIGDTYLVGNSPTGLFTGHAKDIAEWNGSAWVFTDGVQGDFLYNSTTALTYIFRAGNWVQTTGIPALNNGNTISSGLKIGTNNARSLKFETANLERGRIDSLGRYYIYDTSLRYSNKYVQVDSLTGRLIATEIPSNDGFIPLNGTVIGSPVTGDIEIGQDGYKIGIKTGVSNFSGLSFTQSYMALENVANGIETSFSVTNTDGIIVKDNINHIGLIGYEDFSPYISDLGYTQKIYVDQRISDTATQIRSEIADTASSLHSLIDAKVNASGTATLTNKRITARVDSTTSSATPTINTDNIDTYKLTAQAVDITSFTTNLSGTPTDDQILHIVIIGTGARAITWGSKFESSTVTLPTTTVSTNRLDVYFIWNTAVSKWRCGGVW